MNNPSLAAHRREQLEALINQLSLAPNRDSYHNQQILNTAKYCLHQLRQQARQVNRERDYLNSYFSFSNRYDGTLLDGSSSHPCSRNSTQTTNTPSSTTPLTNRQLDCNHLANDLVISSSSSSMVDNNQNGGGRRCGGGVGDTHRTYNCYTGDGNELPPSYDSLMTKSSSLPSYCHLNRIERKE